MMRRFCLLMLCFCISACGFHLRGVADVPQWLSHVCIISKDGSHELLQTLQVELEGYKIALSHTPEQAKYWLIINNEVLQKQIISIGASTNPRQYQLILSINYTLQTRKGKMLVASNTVKTTRQFTMNNDRILGSNDEERTLVSEMRHEAATQLIDRLSRI